MLGVWDVSVAFFHAEMDEHIGLRAKRSPATAGCGTRRASFLFQKKVMEVIQMCGLERLAVTVQLFWHPGRRILVAVHRDDFLAADTQEDQIWLDACLRAELEIKRLPPVGPPAHGGVSSGSFLKLRPLGTVEGFWWCPNTAHSMRVVNEVGKAENKVAQRLLSPSSRDAADLLEQEELKRYQSLAATALGLSADRVDIQFAVCRLMRWMHAPTVLHCLLLERLAAYLRQNPDLGWIFAYHEVPNKFYAETDADWAGDVEARRSVDGGFLVWGTQLIEGWCGEQSYIALWSREAELVAIVNACSRALWLRHFLEIKMASGAAPTAAWPKACAHAWAAAQCDACMLSSCGCRTSRGPGW